MLVLSPNDPLLNLFNPLLSGEILGPQRFSFHIFFPQWSSLHTEMYVWSLPPVVKPTEILSGLYHMLFPAWDLFCTSSLA